MLIFDEYLRPDIVKIRKRYENFLMIKDKKWLNNIYFIYRIEIWINI